jgi:DNA topoisomerase-1
MDLEKALRLLRLPREVGAHPEDGQMILAGIGRYGPFVQHAGTYANLPSVDEVFEVGANRAVALLAEKRAGGPGRGRGEAQPLAELGAHPADGQPVRVMPGRYGPYVKHGSTNANVPRNADPKALTLDEAVKLLAEREAKGGGAKPKRGAKAKPAKAPAAAKAAPAKKAAAKKPAAKKPAPKKATPKKAALA